MVWGRLSVRTRAGVASVGWVVVTVVVIVVAIFCGCSCGYEEILGLYQTREFAPLKTTVTNTTMTLSIRLYHSMHAYGACNSHHHAHICTHIHIHTYIIHMHFHICTRICITNMHTHAQGLHVKPAVGDAILVSQGPHATCFRSRLMLGRARVHHCIRQTSPLLIAAT